MNIVQVSTYRQACGIATYTEALTQELRKQNHNVYVMAEIPPGTVTPEPESHVFYSWRRQTFDGLRFAKSILNSPQIPDVVHFQHEFGIFPREDELFKAIKHLHENSVKCFITLHTVLRFPARKDFWIKLDQSSAKVIVHSAAAQYILFNDDAYVIPHGVELRNDAHVKCTHVEISALVPGFMSPSKGHKEILEIIQKYPGPIELKFVGECKDPAYLTQLDSWIADMGIRDSVKIDLGFKPSLHADLMRADVVILGSGKDSPYSASGQLHTALGYKHLHILAKNVPIYGGTPGVFLYRDPDEALAALHNVMSRPRPSELTEVAKQRSWPIVANKHILYYNGNMGLADRDSGRPNPSNQ